MLRTLVVLGLALGGIALVAFGGRVGSFDVANIPTPMLAFCLVTGLVLIGLRQI
jgi:hypothetical protein